MQDEEQLNFIHRDHVTINFDVTAYEAFCRMTGKSSLPLRVAFWIRDKISSLFGVKEIGGFRRERPEEAPAVGEKLDFFLVEAISDHQLVLTARDTHLDVMLSVDVVAVGPGTSRIFATTSVVTHNWFGRLYMLPVGLAHGVIVRGSLKKLGNR